jgi:lipid A ethanolaminephosphotransferase
MKKQKINLSVKAYSYIFSFITVFVYNFLLYNQIYKSTGSIIGSVIAFICIFLVLQMVFRLFFWSKTTKAISLFLIFFNTVVLYFMFIYNTAIDYVMLLNIIHTDANEAKALLNIKMLFFVIVFFIIPTVCVINTNIQYSDIKSEIKNIAKNIGINILILSIIIAPIGKIADDFYRKEKHLRYYLIPTNYVGAIVSFFKRVDFSTKKKVTIADDIKISKYWNNDKHNLIIYIVGESARAANFSLAGYERNTNEPLTPYLNDLTYFNNFYACGTSTAISVPCALSHYSQKTFKPGSELYTENLTNIMEKVGYKTLWRENNTGCQNTCNRVEVEKRCKKKHCHDEILIEAIEEKLNKISKDTFLVLHQRGSHGPDYYNMYPKEFEKYKPVCKQNILNKCDKKELVNAYDNTILYTSYFLAETIKKIEALSDQYNVMMVYASDHGESLGEDDIYLHSAVYKFAPKEQINIPAIIYIPQSTQKDLSINISCLKNIKDKHLSHDNIFHTILGFAGAKTSIYEEELDILSQCKTN